MEKINTEILVSSLFVIGFDRVDASLYTYTLGKLSIDNQQMQLFEFEDSEPHIIFSKYVDCDGIIFRLKDGITLDTMVSYNDEKFYPLRKMLNTNKRLIEYLSQLDFSEIIVRKLKDCGFNIYDGRFSEKELKLIEELNKASEQKKLKLLAKKVCNDTL